jgi:hypothetical protein
MGHHLVFSQMAGTMMACLEGVKTRDGISAGVKPRRNVEDH